MRLMPSPLRECSPALYCGDSAVRKAGVPLGLGCDQAAHRRSETSGTSLAPSAGTPGPVCHDGFGNLTLAPPPVAEIAPLVAPLVSFHGISGIYERAEPNTGVLEEFQYVEFVPA